MSTESCSSRFTADAKEMERYLELTRKCMERVKSMTSAPCGSTTPKFNSEQCDYLVGKLRLAVESAHFFLELLDGGNVWSPSAEAFAICLENFKLLYTMSGEVESFTRECCRDEWIHAALRLTHVSEHVSSMGFNLQLWSIFVSFVSQRSLTLQEVDSVYSSEVETVKAKASLDKNTLSASLNAVLRVTKSSSSKHNLAAFVLDRLDSSLNPAGELAASLSKEVLQSLKKQKKSLLLGKGGSAHVYRLTWSGAEFAVKTFFGKDNANFNKEVSVLRNLFHPNIVSVLCYVKEMGKCSIIMERMDEDLHSFMQARCGENRPPFGILEGVDIMLQIGRGMHYLHRLRTAHRDLKSANILLRIVQAPELDLEYVMVKVADFGLSKRDLRSMTDTLLTCNTGTARWMAPELIKVSDSENKTLVVEGEALVKNFPLKCDIYSFAIVCCEILTGEHPFADIVTSNEVKRLVLRGTRPRLPAGCPNELRDLIERCWSLNAETRPNFGEICAELQHIKYLLISSAVTADDSLLASSSFASFRRGLQLSHPTEGHRGEAQTILQSHDLDHGKTAKIPQLGDRAEAQTILQSHDLDHDKTAKIPQEDRNVLQCGRPTNSAVSAAMAAGGSVSDYSDVDYCQQSILSIDAVQKLVQERKVQLNIRQCEFLADKLTETGRLLRAKSRDSLVKICGSADIRRKALLHLHFAVKRAEKLVRGCCCEQESWLEAAVTLSHVKEDVKDILLDLRWWTSMLDIAITSVKRKSSGQTIRWLEILEYAEEDFEELLKELHTPNNGLDRAASEDESELLGKVREVEILFAGGGRSAEQKHEYLLAVHVSRLENSDAEAVEDLNEYEDAKLIGFGRFGVVQDVRWMRRRCALKILNRTCKEEAPILRDFQHPHIVKFFRYFETPFRQILNGTPQGTPRSGSEPVYRDSSLSHILMELLPMDLSQYLVKLQDTASSNAGSKRNPKLTGGAPLSVDVALDVMLQTVKALWHLNSKDVSHWGVKPSNLLVRPVSFDEVPELTARGFLWAELAGFGLAKTEAFSYAYSSQPKEIGSKMYGAPEVFNEDIISEKSYPRKVDVWSFGIMFCEVLTGKPPFPGVADGTMRMTVLQEKIVKGLRPKLPENCPDYLKFIIDSCWQLRPEDRPTFEDLWRLMRLAQARSLGLIQTDHDLFYYKTRRSPASLRPQKRITAPAPPSRTSFVHAMRRVLNPNANFWGKR